MIPYADLLGRSWSRSGLDPAGPLSCLGAVLVLLARHGIAPDRLGGPRIDAPAGTDNRPRVPGEPSAATLQAEATLAAWASAAASPWETLDQSAADRPEVGDVWLLDAEGDPAGLAVVVCARQGLAVTSLRDRGVVALRLRALRPKLLRAYRWKGAA